MKIPEYPEEISVFKTTSCPRNVTEYNEVATKYGCDLNNSPPTNRYHCMPNVHLSSLVQFCYPKISPPTEPGNCWVLTSGGIIDQRNCTDFREGCPSKIYKSHEMYNFLQCWNISVEGQCYVAVDSCSSQLASTMSSTSPALTNYFPGLLVGMTLLLMTITAILFIFYIKKLVCCKQLAATKISKSRRQSKTFQQRYIDYLKSGQVDVNLMTHCLIVGEAGVGKTTLVYRLKKAFKEIPHIKPTRGIGVHEYMLQANKEKLEDLGSSQDSKPILRPTIETVRDFEVNENQKKETRIESDPNIAHTSEETVVLFHTTKAEQEHRVQHVASEVFDETARLYIDDEDDTQYSNKNYRVSNPLSNEPSNTMVEFTNESIVQPNEEVSFPDVDQDVSDLLTVLDFAGQGGYYASHQIHLRKRAFFILVVSMAKVKKEKGGNLCERPGTKFSKWNGIDFFLYWLRNIHYFCGRDVPVIVVATHAENETEEAKTQLFKNLREHADKAGLKGHLDVRREFAIGMKNLKKFVGDMEKLEKCMVQMMKKGKEKLPAKWIKFETRLRQLRRSKYIIPTNVVIEIADDLSEPLEESELVDMLEFFHDVGMIIYFSVDLLKNTIILDTQWFVDAFISLITDVEHAKLDYPDIFNKHEREWNYFTDTGRLSGSLLEIIWKVKQVSPFKDILLSYMGHLCMITPIENDWYIPCVNQRIPDEKELSKTGSAQSSIIASFVFDFLPDAIYFRLIASCMKDASLVPRKDGFYQTISFFIYDAKQSEEQYVAISTNRKIISVQVIPPSKLTGSGMNILANIEKSLKDVISMLCLTDPMNYKRGFVCDNENGYTDETWEYVISEEEIKENIAKDKLKWICNKCTKQHLFNTERASSFWWRKPDNIIREESEEANLHDAVHKGQLKNVEDLLKRDVDINMCNDDGESPLFIASGRGFIKIVNLLLEKGAEINAYTNGKETSVFIASHHGNAEIVQILASNGADVNLCRSDGQSPLFDACREGFLSVVKILLQYHANVNHTCPGGSSPLFTASSKGNLKIVDMLIHKGANVNLCTDDGRSPLNIASTKGFREIASKLLDNGAYVNLRQDSGASPLFRASREGHVDTAELLLERGANVNTGKKDGTTPLFIASQKGHPDIVELLLSKGADVNLRPQDDDTTPIEIAHKYDHESVVQLLKDYIERMK